jgi:hypothetical protein
VDRTDYIPVILNEYEVYEVYEVYEPYEVCEVYKVLLYINA